VDIGERVQEDGSDERTVRPGDPAGLGTHEDGAPDSGVTTDAFLTAWRRSPAGSPTPVAAFRRLAARRPATTETSTAAETSTATVAAGRPPDVPAKPEQHEAEHHAASPPPDGQPGDDPWAGADDDTIRVATVHPPGGTPGGVGSGSAGSAGVFVGRLSRDDQFRVLGRRAVALAMVLLLAVVGSVAAAAVLVR